MRMVIGPLEGLQEGQGGSHQRPLIATAPPPSRDKPPGRRPAVEVSAVIQLCEGLLADAGWDAVDEGVTLAETPHFADGAQIAAVRSGNGMLLVRRPEGGNLVLPSRAALALLTRIFPAARQELEALGFGLVQQGEQALPEADEGHA